MAIEWLPLVFIAQDPNSEIPYVGNNVKIYGQRPPESECPVCDQCPDPRWVVLLHCPVSQTKVLYLSMLIACINARTPYSITLRYSRQAIAAIRACRSVWKVSVRWSLLIQSYNISPLCSQPVICMQWVSPFSTRWWMRNMALGCAIQRQEKSIERKPLWPTKMMPITYSSSPRARNIEWTVCPGTNTKYLKVFK